MNKATELLSKMNKSSMKSRVGATHTGEIILSHSITICYICLTHDAFVTFFGQKVLQMSRG